LPEETPKEQKKQKEQKGEMPSAQKQARTAERKGLRNKSVRSRAKTLISKAEDLIFAGEIDKAKEVVVAAISALDKAAERGVIHPNNAARRKARLMKKLNSAVKASV